MTGRIQYAIKNKLRVTLAEVERGERGLTCYTCDDKLVVKDGAGQFVTGEGRRHQKRGKHFSHTANSSCHGEGPAHYQIKVALCRAINHALTMSMENRNSHGSIQYRCHDSDYGPHDIFKFEGGLNREFEAMQHGYHQYDLLRSFDHAAYEVRLGGGRTRADIAGLDKDNRVVWIIEIKRSGLSQAAIDYAKESGTPLFVIDLSHLPQPTPNDPMAEIENISFDILASNMSRGFYPLVTESYNAECERKAFGMGPSDQTWARHYAPVHRGSAECKGDVCSDCAEVVIHECGGLECPDSAYIFEHGIGFLQMYLDPVHSTNSHIPPAWRLLEANL